MLFFADGLDRRPQPQHFRHRPPAFVLRWKERWKKSTQGEIYRQAKERRSSTWSETLQGATFTWRGERKSTLNPSEKTAVPAGAEHVAQVWRRYTKRLLQCHISFFALLMQACWSNQSNNLTEQAGPGRDSPMGRNLEQNPNLEGSCLLWPGGMKKNQGHQLVFISNDQQKVGRFWLVGPNR